jgi:hypothetical protein
MSQRVSQLNVITSRIKSLHNTTVAPMLSTCVCNDVLPNSSDRQKQGIRTCGVCLKSAPSQLCLPNNSRGRLWTGCIGGGGVVGVVAAVLVVGVMMMMVEVVEVEVVVVADRVLPLESVFLTSHGFGLEMPHRPAFVHFSRDRAPRHPHAGWWGRRTGHPWPDGCLSWGYARPQLAK